MLFGDIATVHYENQTKHLNTLYGHNAEIFSSGSKWYMKQQLGFERSRVKSHCLEKYLLMNYSSRGIHKRNDDEQSPQNPTVLNKVCFHERKRDT
jgi:hypothetical protein